MTQRFGQKLGLGILLGVGILTGSKSAVQAAPLLAVDVNDRAPDSTGDPDSLTQPGYLSFLMPGLDSSGQITSTLGTTRELGGYSVTIAPIAGTGGSGGMDDRDRDWAPQTPSNYELYDDFIFNNQAGGGLRLTIGGVVGGNQLQANQQYSISIYAYDHSSTGDRVAKWLDQNNSDALVLTTAFAGGVNPVTGTGNQPTTVDQYKFTGTAVTDANGTLSIHGLADSTRTASTLQAVFISGFDLNVVPEPTTIAAVAGLAGLVATRRRSRR